MLVYEVTSIKPLTPDQQRIKSLQKQVKQSQQAVKIERGRQKLAKAQRFYQKALT